jgi:hypothetical protein
MTYNEARDAYGNLSREQRGRVLDLVSTFTDAQAGAAAEAAFVRALEQVQAEARTYGYFGYSP